MRPRKVISAAGRFAWWLFYAALIPSIGLLGLGLAPWVVFALKPFKNPDSIGHVAVALGLL